MGVKNDIRWMREESDRANLFALVAKRGPLKVREIRDFLKADDWWPVKHQLKNLMDKELIEEVKEGYRVTDYGEKVFESLRTVHDIESL